MTKVGRATQPQAVAIFTCGLRGALKHRRWKAFSSWSFSSPSLSVSHICIKKFSVTLELAVCNKFQIKECPTTIFFLQITKRF